MIDIPGLAFAAIVGVVLVVSAALSAWLGARGTLLAAAATGLVDAHATAASVASLVAAGKLPLDAAPWPILAGLSSNALMKAVVAFHAGGAAYAARAGAGAGHRGGLAGRVAGMKDDTLRSHAAEYIAANAHQ